MNLENTRENERVNSTEIPPATRETPKNSKTSDNPIVGTSLPTTKIAPFLALSKM